MTLISVPSISAKMVCNARLLSATGDLHAMVVFTTWTPWKLRIFHFVSDQLIHIICIITFRTRLIQTWSSTLEIHKCTAVLIRIVMLQRSELYTDAIRLRAYGSDTYLMTRQNWSTSVNLSVSFTKGNGTVSCLNIFGCVRRFTVMAAFIGSKRVVRDT